MIDIRDYEEGGPLFYKKSGIYDNHETKPRIYSMPSSGWRYLVLVRCELMGGKYSHSNIDPNVDGAATIDYTRGSSIDSSRPHISFAFRDLETSKYVGSSEGVIRRRCVASGNLSVYFMGHPILQDVLDESFLIKWEGWLPILRHGSKYKLDHVEMRRRWRLIGE